MTDAERTIFAIKGDADWAETIFESLQSGVGRFGWSDNAGADLQRLKKKIDTQGWTSLTSDEAACYQPFLLDLKPDDWVVYVNVPKWGQCTVAKVTAPYFWEFSDEDFNHRFAVDPKSVQEFNRNDAMVPNALKARLKLQGKYWRIYAAKEFESLLSDLHAGTTPKPSTPETNARRLVVEIEPLLLEITHKIQRTHHNYDLEKLLELVFREIPDVRNVIRQGGAGDHGADLIVEYEAGLPHPAFLTQHVCVVQVKSYVDQHWDTKAVQDIERAFAKYPAAMMGLIISTATSSTSDLDKAISELKAKIPGKRVELLIGADVARFILHFGRSILGFQTQPQSVDAARSD